MTHRNADTRIREAFDALREELRDIFGEPTDPLVWKADGKSTAYDWAMNDIRVAQEELHVFAKLPADA